MAACPGRAPGCFRNNNPDKKFLCNVCADRLQRYPAGTLSSQPTVSGTDALIAVAQKFEVGDEAGYQAILAPWLPIIRTVEPPPY